MISILSYIKKNATHFSKNLDEHILTLDRQSAFRFLEKEQNVTMLASKQTRHLLYKHLKGKDSPLEVYSVGTKEPKYIVIKVK